MEAKKYKKTEIRFDKIKNIYKIGNGSVGIGGITQYEDDGETIVNIMLGLKNLDKSYEVGENISFKEDINDTETLILFENIEGLNVLRKQLDRIEEKFKLKAKQNEK